MKRYLFSILCCAILKLEAAPDHKITITPTQTVSPSGKKEYLAEIELDDALRMSFVCMEGEKADMELESPDKTDFLAVTVLIPENNPTNEATTSIYLEEAGEVVLSMEETIKINCLIKARSWSDRRKQLLKFGK